MLPPSRILSRDEGRIFTEPQDSSNGSFVFPRKYPLTFREGSSINISWTKSYKTANLFFYQRGKVATSVQLVTNFATDWYQWEVRAKESNITNPFVFRVVDAQGTVEEQNNGGFWSSSWYIVRDDVSSSSTISSTPTQQSSSVTQTSYPSTSMQGTYSETKFSTTQSIQSENTAFANPLVVSSRSAISRGALIGLAVGLVVAGAIIIIGMIYCLKKRKAGRRKAGLSPTLTAPYFEGKPHHQVHTRSGLAHEVYSQPSELQAGTLYFELPTDKQSR